MPTSRPVTGSHLADVSAALMFALVVVLVLAALYKTTIGASPKVVEPERPCLWTIDRGRVNCDDKEKK